MKYLGSKKRIAKDILPIILKNRRETQFYVEPFCGGCNTICHVDGNRIANDSNKYIIEMWKSLVYKNWNPPEKITEEEYKNIKFNKENYPYELVGFAGVCLSFGSTWFGAYSKNKRNTNYAMEGRNNLLKQAKQLKGTIFLTEDYKNIKIPKNSIIYCDPPYLGVYPGYLDTINHEEFWDYCREKTINGNEVYISEYNAPEDFEIIWEKKIITKHRETFTSAVERLFKYKG